MKIDKPEKPALPSKKSSPTSKVLGETTNLPKQNRNLRSKTPSRQNSPIFINEIPDLCTPKEENSYLPTCATTSQTSDLNPSSLNTTQYSHSNFEDSALSMSMSLCLSTSTSADVSQCSHERSLSSTSQGLAVENELPDLVRPLRISNRKLINSKKGKKSSPYPKVSPAKSQSSEGYDLNDSVLGKR